MISCAAHLLVLSAPNIVNDRLEREKLRLASKHWKMLAKHKTSGNSADLCGDQCFAIKIVFAIVSAVSLQATLKDRSCIHDRLFKFFRIRWRVAQRFFYVHN